MSYDMPPAKTELPIVQLLPNLVTLAAICAGLTAIRFGFQGHFTPAVLLILTACILDAIDGKLARLLKCESPMGAELDSLADFLNFGIASPVLIYLYTLQDMPRAGWFAVLMFAVCSVIRLARFNVGKKSELDAPGDQYFVGVPAPAGALLVLLPMFIAFLSEGEPVLPNELVGLWMAAVGLMMISRIPTYSLKMMTISRDNVKFFLLASACLFAALLNYLWLTLVIIDVVYFASVLWSWGMSIKKKRA
jgi:CDP-diacylglycerol--serine O-phosphatidyltransferase